MNKSDKVIQQEAERIRKFVNEENTAELTYKQKDAIKFAIQAIIKNDKRGDFFSSSIKKQVTLRQIQEQ